MGSGVRPVPDTSAEGLNMFQEVALDVFGDCVSNCSAVAAVRSLPLPSWDYYGPAGGGLAFTLLGGGAGPATATYPRAVPRWGFDQGRLVPAENRGLLTLAGYQSNAWYDPTIASGKREPSILRLGANGSWNHTTPCTVFTLATYNRIYCNGFDNVSGGGSGDVWMGRLRARSC